MLCPWLLLPCLPLLCTLLLLVLLVLLIIMMTMRVSLGGKLFPRYLSTFPASDVQLTLRNPGTCLEYPLLP
jgi:hypothetical protein